MADLPQERCNKAAPLSYCGVDMFGPLIIKERRSELKCYSALFIGFSSRASLHVKYRQKKKYTDKQNYTIARYQYTGKYLGV